MDSKIITRQQLAQQEEIGNYRLLSLIGQGGFADVYLAEHIYLQTQAALKIFRARPNDEQMEGFLAQVRQLARLKHAHILPVLACDVQDGCPFLVMPYAPGGTLRQRHPRGSQLPLATVLSYLNQLAPALDAAHSAGQIHGDVKPENMLLGAKGELLLSDFGLAPVVEQAPGKPQAMVTGTVTYMAPEQLASRAEPASDQYALAILVYEWLSGKPPFSGSYTEVATQHALIPSPALGRSDLAPQCERVLLRALAKNPRERFSSVQAFANALQEAASAPIAPAPSTRQDISRRKLLWGLVGAGGVAALGAGLSWQLHAQPTSGAGANVSYIYRGHTERVYSLSWSPDSTRLISADVSGSAQVWQAVVQNNAARGKLLGSLTIGPALNFAGNGDPTSLVWAPGTNLIALGDYPGKIQVWDSISQQDRFILREYTTLGTCIAWSPDSTRLAAAAYAADRNELIVAFWDLTTGNRLANLQLTSAIKIIATANVLLTPLGLAWSPNGQRIALSDGRDTTEIWELPSRRLLSTLPAGSNDLTWSPNSIDLALGNQVWDTTAGKQQHSYGSASNSAAWSPNGTYLATGGKDMQVSIWNTRTGQLAHTYKGHTAPINAIRWSPNGSLLASASDDQTVRIFAV